MTASDEPESNVVPRTAMTLLAVVVVMGGLIIFMLRSAPDPLAAMGFRVAVEDNVLAWLMAGAITMAYVVYAARIPLVRVWLFRLHWLKLLAVVAAICAGILEELVFRKLLMDWLASTGIPSLGQVAASGIAFGLAHLVWGGPRADWRDAAGAVLATAVLGFALAVLYLLAGRNVAPCIVAHVLITAAIEPGLLLAAFSGRLRESARDLRV